MRCGPLRVPAILLRPHPAIRRCGEPVSGVGVLCTRSRWSREQGMAICSECGGDIDVDECKSFPCKNGATCTDSTTESAVSYHAYQCTCVAGFANGVCEYKKNPKETKPNKDHEFIKEFKAECTVMESMAQWKNSTLGGNCDIDVDECASSPCANGATCTESAVESEVSFHTYQCTCVAGFANGWCEYDFIAQYSAECTVSESGNSSRWSGNCNIDVDECASSPCANGATCHDSVDDASIPVHTYQCVCLLGFANGACGYTDYISEYTAQCTVPNSAATAFSGNCDVDVDECKDVSQAYGVKSMPTFKLIKGGKEADRLVAQTSEQKIKALLDKAVAK